MSNEPLKLFYRQAAGAHQSLGCTAHRFRRLAESTQIARKSAQDLLKFAENASKTDLFRSTDHLTSALEQAQTDNQNFLQSFSAVQKSELEKITKKLGKANSDVTKRSKALTSDLERSRIARQQISGVAERLDKALNWETAKGRGSKQLFSPQPNCTNILKG